MNPHETLLSALRRDGVTDERVLKALAAVPRERFVPPGERHLAYHNVALGIDAGQTISQPSVVATMTQALDVAPHERVLEIGTGSGYQTAVLAELAGHVFSVERHPDLSASAAAVLAELAYTNITLCIGDGTLGWPPEAPYDAIMITAAGPRVPDSLFDQLTPDGGRLIMPVGTRAEQTLLLVYRHPEGRSLRELGAVRFVPLLGAHGWPEQP